MRNAGVARDQIRALSALAKTPITVAVIPGTEGATPSEIQKFRDELEKFREDGFELLLHGFRHLAESGIRRNLWGKFALNLTGQEAEFAGLSEADARPLLLQAFAAWESLGLDSPKGFVPPAWYGSCSLKKSIAQVSGLEFYEDRFAVYRKDHTQKFRRIFSPALSFAGLPDCALSLTLNVSRLALRFPFVVPRLVFHPVDFSTLGWARIENLVREALLNRKVVPYRAL